MKTEDKGLGSTSMFEVLEIVFDDGDFAVARGLWDEEKKESYACRWHAGGRTIGYPQTFGKPQWMRLPASEVTSVTKLVSENGKPNRILRVSFQA